MKKQILALFATAFLFASAARAADVSVGADIGTTGAGVHLSTPVTTNLNGRIGFNGINYSYNTTSNNVNYDAKLKAQTFDALLDFYPGGGSFRLTGGLVYNGNKVDVTAKPSGAGTYTFQGHTYSVASAGVVNGNVDFNKANPYLGIGFGNSVKDAGWSFSTDLGVMFSGHAKATLASTGCTAGAVICDQLASDLAVQQGSLQSKLNDLRYYPVLRVGVAYRF